MSEAYERERQNNSRLDELSSKITALRGVTIDIYDNARNQDVLDNTVPPPPLLLSHLKKKNNRFPNVRIERSLLHNDNIHKRQRGAAGSDGA
ncbi:MAG: hypothetical protein Q9212_005460 [Teloschistes hypoglaucus]